jgi:hypothetical protein
MCHFICGKDIRIMWCGRRVSDLDTPSSLGMRTEEQLDCWPALKGGKPVIYLQPPHPISEATVTLSLSREWDFSAIYPVRTPEKTADGRSSISWTVDADATSELTDKDTGRKLAYLYWEALSCGDASSLRPVEESATGTDDRFNPAAPSLTPENAALLQFDAFLVHLDTALATLGLHVSARNDFVTYWLPAFVRLHERGRRIAFRFLQKADYERAAMLDVTPRPDVVTRVFLLFGGVAPDAGAEWAAAAHKASDVDWKNIVGVTDAAFDEKKFRVLEWGGMEVHLEILRPTTLCLLHTMRLQCNIIIFMCTPC